MMKHYNPKELEPKWQQIWEETKLHEASESSANSKYYQLEFFPYPSGVTMHVGSVRNYAISDAMSRYQRMKGYNVLHPMGWDSFGLPAENYAIKTGTPPRQSIDQNKQTFKRQMLQMGFSYDWSREIDSSDPGYYQWTQWCFLFLYEHGLAYRGGGMQNWCPSCQTVLANEQVTDSKCERCDTPVEKKELKQWFFKITDYADRLLEDLKSLDWPEHIKTMQENWIGRSEGALISFQIPDSKLEIEAFTTRPDTLYGATYMVLAPEHHLVDEITAKDKKEEVEEYVKQAQKKSDIERQEEDKAKTGVFTGAYATNPVNEEKIPVWVADYVLMGYGTGAIMAVPAHDQRDYEFAKNHDLPVKTVIEPVTGEKQDNPQYRRSIVAVVENSEGKLLSINWGAEHGGNLFIGGGLEENEDLEDCAKREIQEETGYKNVEFVSQTETVHHNYFAKIKNIPREIEAVGMYFKLTDEEQDDQQLEEYEKDKFNVEWISKEEAGQKVMDPLHSYVFERLILDEVYTGDGKVTGSGEYDGMESADMRAKIVENLKSKKKAEPKVNYKLHDWLISRQRYWGAPIPIVYCEKCGTVPVPEEELPVELPEVESYQPSGDGRSPLARVDSFVKTTCPRCQGPAERETDTMDGFACSSWYFLRFTDPYNEQEAWSKDKADYWMPVDMYIGGAEHAVMHLLYARFWHKAFYDAGLVNTKEPFKALRNQGMISGSDGRKMSKRYGNVVTPDDLISSGYGADSLRLYELFIAPYNQGADWDNNGVVGSYRFLNRVWNLMHEYLDNEATEQTANKSEKEVLIERSIHKTIKKVTDDMEGMRFNTAIASLMEYVNDLYKLKNEFPPDSGNDTWKEALSVLLRLLAPFAPHITEELWHQAGNHESVHIDPWPVHDEDKITSDMVDIVLQVNGKVRGTLTVPSGSSDEEISRQARETKRVADELKDKEIAKEIVVPDKLINFVVH